jgi:lipoprotein-releasing system ATP-binding protein
VQSAALARHFANGEAGEVRKSAGPASLSSNRTSTAIFVAMSVLVATGIRKCYESLQVLGGVNLAIAKSEVVAIVGSSGAGKSTLLHILGTLDAPDAGTVLVNEVDTSRLKGQALAHFRNATIGFVFQFHHLLPEFSALENVCMPAWIARASPQNAEKRAGELLALMGLQDRLHHKPGQLSGGEQQRVAVARALINGPAVVFADEPTGNLDSQHAADMHGLFFTLRAQLNQTFVIVTHNESLANLCDRQLHMKDGLIVSDLASASATRLG